MNMPEWTTALNVVFLVLAVGSILVSVILYRKTKKERKPVYNIKTFSLLNEKAARLKGLAILYKGGPVKNFTLTKVGLWNKGRETINWSDVAPQDKIRIEIAEEYKILDSEITFSKKQANNFRITLSEDKQTLFIEFDYFHFNEGIVVDLYHTGTSSNDVRLLGTVKGVEHIEFALVGKDKYTDFFFRRFLWPLPRWARFVLLPIALPGIAPAFILLQLLDFVNERAHALPEEFEL